MGLSTPSSLELLIVQPTAFCNIDCRYCYLPDRSSKGNMSGRTLRSLFNRLKGYDEIDDSFSLVWHAGEPLAAGLEFYRNAAQHIDAFHVEKDVRIREFIQTNGTLITAAWCDWFAERDIRIGLSIDGPDHVHDQNRIDRRGGGTHKKCMDGLRLLSEYGISFYNIAVISDYSLDYPDDIFDFFVDNGIFDFGVNFAEIEGVNIASAVLKKEFEGRAEEFLRRFIERVETGPRHVRMRELDGFKSYLSHGPRRGLSQNCKPGAIISVSRDGLFSTFAPELLGIKVGSQPFSPWNLDEHSFADMFRDQIYRGFADKILEGARQCELACDYFDICGGGSPSNKFAENERFDSTETRSCKLGVQMMSNVIADQLLCKQQTILN